MAPGDVNSCYNQCFVLRLIPAFIAYEQAYKDCALRGSKVPKPVAIQQLVQAWKLREFPAGVHDTGRSTLLT